MSTCALQVHRATLLDGTRIALKVQKPWIAVQMPWDLFCYQFLVWALEKSFDLPMFWTTQSACRAIRDEADFTTEAKYSERAAAAWAQSEFASRVHVPSVFWQHTSRRVLAQEWVEGIKINELQKLEQAGFDRKA